MTCMNHLLYVPLQEEGISVDDICTLLAVRQQESGLHGLKEDQQTSDGKFQGGR